MWCAVGMWATPSVSTVFESGRPTAVQGRHFVIGMSTSQLGRRVMGPKIVYLSHKYFLITYFFIFLFTKKLVSSKIRGKMPSASSKWRPCSNACEVDAKRQRTQASTWTKRIASDSSGLMAKPLEQTHAYINESDCSSFSSPDWSIWSKVSATHCCNWIAMSLDKQLTDW